MSDYETELTKVENENSKYLNVFEKNLIKQGLSNKTIRNHVSNVEFYINDFLNYYELQHMQQGCYQIDEFLGDWFIRKAMWSSCTNITSTAASIKKFYKTMLEHDYIKQKDYDILCNIIKEKKDRWISNMEKYDEESEEFF